MNGVDNILYGIFEPAIYVLLGTLVKYRMQCAIHGKRIEYDTYGTTGPAVVMVHGWGGSRKSVAALSQLLSDEFRVFAPDLPGFGDSDRPDPDWGVGEYAACVKAFISRLEVPRPIYFGHSFGGSLGIFLSSYDPELFSGLVLCASAYRRTAQTSGIAVRLNRLVEQRIAFAQPLVSAIKPILYRVLFRNSDLGRFPELESNYRKIIVQDLSDRVEHLSIPTLLVWGDQDTYTPPDMAEDLNKRIAGSVLKMYPGVGHGLPKNHYQLIEPDVRAFLRTLPIKNP